MKKRSVPRIEIPAGTDLKTPYQGKTAMRVAFENIVAPRQRSRLVGKILRSLRSKRGTFTANGWRKVS